MQTIPPPGMAQPTPVVPPPQQPHPTRSRSPLGRLIMSLAVLAVGLVGVADLAGAGIPLSVYLAVALTVVAAGLVIGAWYGRARV